MAGWWVCMTTIGMRSGLWPWERSKARRPFVVEYRLLHADGSYHWVVGLRPPAA